VGLLVSEASDLELDKIPHDVYGDILYSIDDRLLCGQREESSLLEVIPSMVFLVVSRSRGSTIDHLCIKNKSVEPGG